MGFPPITYPTITIQASGGEECAAMLKDLPNHVTAMAYTKGLEAAAKVFEEELKITTPIKPEDERGGILERGELVKSLQHQITIDPSYKAGLVDIGYGDNTKVANWVEYGHRMVAHKGGKTIGMVPEHPFIRPAFDARAEAAVTAFVDAVSEVVQREYPQTTAAA